MTIWQPVSERERAVATVAHCGQRLWHAQEAARRADEQLRRAIRDVDDAEQAALNAARRLERIDALGERVPRTVSRAPLPDDRAVTLRLLA